jgi:hypothetical protein
MVAGVMYWLNGWTKTSGAGAKFLSLSVKPIEGQAAPKPTNNHAPVAAGNAADDGDGLPF